MLEKVPFISFQRNWQHQLQSSSALSRLVRDQMISPYVIQEWDGAVRRNSTAGPNIPIWNTVS
jgi:hypothetical protein